MYTPKDIADHLRTLDTEDEGNAYLEDLHLDRAGLLAVGWELGMTRLESERSIAKLKDRIIKQAIGARNKFAGLRTWKRS